ncbi:MAG: hypothetical protein ABSC92_03315 [Rhizomicrobium sp.]
MKWHFALGNRYAWRAATVGAFLLCAAIPAQAAPPAPTEAQLQAAWGATISQTPLPGRGCFTAAYPATAWSQVACTSAPDHRYEPAHGTSGYTVGDGNDYAAVAAHTISSSVGSFPMAKGVTVEKDGKIANEYSLQLNTQFISGSPACAGAATPSSCQAWQQFVFAEQGGKEAGGVLFMQYWLIDYVKKCPAGWIKYSTDCYTNSSAVSVPKQTISQLRYLAVSGAAVAGGLDTVLLTTKTLAYSTTGDDSVVDLADFWNASEFGTEATFNAGPTVTVKITVVDGSAKAPTCASSAGTTAETNNLTLGTCKANGGAMPGIKFTETN